MKNIGWLLFLFVLIPIGCKRASTTTEESPKSTPVPTAVSEASLKQYELQQALMVLQGARLNAAEVQHALSVLRAQEAPERIDTNEGLPDPFSPNQKSSTVLEVYPEAGIEITLKGGQVMEVRKRMEAFDPEMSFPIDL